MAPASPPRPAETKHDPGLLAAEPEVIAAFTEHERIQGSGRLIVGCWLVITLLPLGFLVDLVKYPDDAENLRSYATARLIGALLTVPLLWLFYSGRAGRYYRTLGVLLAVIPGLVMCYIIRDTPAPWPYYASINLILLAMAIVAQWTWRQSTLACLVLLGGYTAATYDGLLKQPGDSFSNLWFLVLTGIIMVVGSELQFRLRFRSFVANEALRRSREELESHYVRLQELDQLKDRFFANVSHELRTPLTLLLTPLERLVQEASRDASPWRETVETMRDNGLRLLKLINNLLDLVKLDARQLELQPVPIQLPTFLHGMTDAVRSLAEERGLRLSCEVAPHLPTLIADPEKLDKVVLNLLYNAIKFTAAGGSIRVTAQVDGNMIRLDVTDTGIGIAPEHQAFLFSRFWQADSSSQRKSQGTGLGLAIVKELVLAHGGAVAVESQLGQGSTFTVRLPLQPPARPVVRAPASPSVAPPAPAPAAPPDSPKVDAAWLSDLYRRAERFGGVSSLRASVRPWRASHRRDRPRVLVVDDEPDLLRLVQTQLSGEYEVIEAVDGEQAITLAAQCLPDVIVCDLMLPEKDGIEVCRALRSQPATRALPLLMLTARADDATRLRALGAGANDFLSKPFSLAELSARVRSLSNSHQLQLALSRQNQKLEATLEDLRDTETQLVQAEKMASLGRMSAGIIHEINNPLNYALTALELLSFKASSLPELERPEYEETVRDVEEGLRRVAGIIGDLRLFTHPQGGEIEDVPVRAAALAALRFLAAELKNRVTIENRLPEDLTVPAVRSKLIQVFLNLLQNSLDALRDRQGTDNEPRIILSAETQAQVTRIRIRDNGPGIPAELLSRIFDPFFTTKEVGEGTGLGLSICFRLLNEVGATITVESRVGEFCEFTMVFGDREGRGSTLVNAVERPVT